MVGQKEEVRGPSLDLHEGQTGPCSSIRLAVSNTQSLALGANVMSVVGQCHLRPQCSEGAVSLKLDPALALNSRSLPRSQLSVTMGFSLARPLSLALALSFLPVCYPILPASFPTPRPGDWFVNSVSPRPMFSLFTRHRGVRRLTSFRS